MRNVKCSRCGETITATTATEDSPTVCQNCLPLAVAIAQTTMVGKSGQVLERSKEHLMTSCESCGTRYRVAAKFAGKATKCSKCGCALTVPQLASRKPQLAFGPTLTAGDARSTPEIIAPLPYQRWAIFAGFVLVATALVYGTSLLLFNRTDSGPNSVANLAPATAAPAKVNELPAVEIVQQTEPENVPLQDILEPLVAESTVESATESPQNEPSELPVAVEQGLSPEQIIAEAEPSVVTIRVEKELARGSGSGFLIDAAGTVVTNYHVVEGAKSVTIILASGEEVKSSGWYVVSPEKDLALIELSPPMTLDPLPLKAELPNKAEVVYALGNPLGELAGTVSNGIVSSIRQGHELSSGLAKNLKVIQTTASLSRGNSGGPLLDRRGQVVGVVMAGRTKGQNLNFCVSSQHVVELIGKKRRLPLLWAQLPPPRPENRDVAQDTAGDRADDAQRAAEKLAAGIKDAEKMAADSRAKQAKLDRINQAISDLEMRIGTIEAEGTSLTKERGQIMSEAEGLMAEGGRLEQQVAILRNTLARVQSEISVFIPRDEGGYEHIRIRRQQSRTLESEIATAQQRYAAIEGRLVTIDRQARDLLGQIDYKADQRDGMEGERQTLLLQGEIVSVGVPEFINRLFTKWDRDGDGMLNPREAPDKYDPIMNAANLDNDNFVSKQELESAIGTFGESPQ